jgi:hypothetical protein
MLHDNNDDYYCEATISYSMGKILLVKNDPERYITDIKKIKFFMSQLRFG